MINNKIQEAYCSFEVSKLLKEKVFGIHVFSYYKNEGKAKFNIFPHYEQEPDNWNADSYIDTYSIPTHALAIEWIRVNFGIWITVGYLGDGYNCTIQNKKGYTKKAMGNFKTPQEATEAALLYTLQNLIP